MAWYNLVLTAWKIGWLISPLLLIAGFAIQSALSFIGVISPFFLQMALDKFSDKAIGPTFTDFLLPVIAYGMSKFVSRVIDEIASKITWYPVDRMVDTLDIAAIDKALSMPISWMRDRGSDKVMKIFDRSYHVTEMISLFTNDHYSEFLRFSSSLLMAISILPRLWIVLVAPLIPYAALVTWFSWRQDKAWDASDEVDLDIDETFDVISNARDIKLFGAERSQILRRSLLSQYRTKLNQKADWLGSFNRVGQSLIKGVACIALMLVCFDALSEGVITVGQLGLLISLQETLFAPLNQIYYMVTSTQTALRKVKPFFALLREIDPLGDRPNATDLPVLTDKFSFKNVSFSYLASQPTPTLSNISFDVPKGSTLAVVGPSGAGKSTLSSLILRFADPSSGSVQWDGIDLRDSTRNSLRKLALLVPQDISLMNRTVRENIAFGVESTPLEDVIAAAKAANAHEFIEKLEHGYQTMVGERGVILSGGQRQRVALARVILRRPSVLVLDEATSHLDSENERLIQDAIENLDSTTKIIIAHRLSTVIRADNILVMDQGQIVGMGKHKDLIGSCPLYKRLYELQYTED
eukprot:TRINITY_DN4932_c0_g1_i1.p1 TRINITY_DN4932_c0_g1~~TRINITY_DN4932_c0_g1_i1.p1  ORF type:complete len:653 (+),score=125.83 TRINITY_DN4932_c0_g1_i1:219-1961(+)